MSTLFNGLKDDNQRLAAELANLANENETLKKNITQQNLKIKE